VIQDVSLKTFSAFWQGSNEGSGGSGSGTSTSLIVFVPESQVSAQVIASISNLSYWGYDFSRGELQIAPWSTEWGTAAGIVRYLQSPAVSTFLPQPATIEHIPNCIAIQFVLDVSVFPDSNSPQVDMNASISALASATIFLES